MVSAQFMCPHGYRKYAGGCGDQDAVLREKPAHQPTQPPTHPRTTQPVKQNQPATEPSNPPIQSESNHRKPADGPADPPCRDWLAGPECHEPQEGHAVR